jgi:hypothetical protein
MLDISFTSIMGLRRWRKNRSPYSLAPGCDRRTPASRRSAAPRSYPDCGPHAGARGPPGGIERRGLTAAGVHRAVADPDRAEQAQAEGQALVAGGHRAARAPPARHSGR